MIVNTLFVDVIFSNEFNINILYMTLFSNYEILSFFYCYVLLLEILFRFFSVSFSFTNLKMNVEFFFSFDWIFFQLGKL